MLLSRSNGSISRLLGATVSKPQGRPKILNNEDMDKMVAMLEPRPGYPPLRHDNILCLHQVALRLVALAWVELGIDWLLWARFGAALLGWVGPI